MNPLRNAPLLNAGEFEVLGRKIAKYKQSRSEKVTQRRFKAEFGVPTSVAAIVWQNVVESSFLRDNIHGLKPPDPKHMLWALMLLKQYSNHETLAKAAQADVKTFRKWSELYLEAIAELDSTVVSQPLFPICLGLQKNVTEPLFSCCLLFSHQIKWENRFIGDTNEQCLVTVDGTHFKICNKYRPNSKKYNTNWYTYKFNSAGVSYEMAVCIKTGDIVWINGPFPAATPDISIFRFRLRDILAPGEKVIADRGYRGDSKVVTPYDYRSHQHKLAMGVLRARHETVNRRFKTFGALQQCFRHTPHKHHMFFRAAAVLIQIGHKNGYSHFHVVGYVDPKTEQDWE
jgi:hypothetical protein